MTTNDNRTITADNEAPVHREDDDQYWQASDAAQYHAAQAALETVLPPAPVPAERALKKELNQLWHTLETRPVIGLARTIVMRLGGCTHDEAFQVLVDVSRYTNIELREIAQRLVDSVDGPPPSGPLRTALHNAFERLDTTTVRPDTAG
ncbi:ANTAR domain-containing protein [Streptomyces sp. ISL-99]|uniref:ANTAR domain-containing protein n=1 Tax=Streptomyces sp. ISL-99 TaxID=2819193 RepID=UPI001BECE87D|nr:ANTAR domain-containing protein [Streptomyces sp. ISL-99]MBT2524430.1 ANTAR domain-containing protein [Streptomyces sp. ISL-99]